MKRRLAVAAAMLLLACDAPERRVVTLTFDDSGERVTINATTYVGEGQPDSDERRSALIAERDEWAQRFRQADPETESVTWQRTKGKLDWVERRAIVNVDDLQKFFYDTPITITTLRGDGWIELAIYAGSSTRATNEQKRIAQKILTAYSARAARYFHAVRSLYAYLDERPQRAQILFEDVFADEKDPRPLISETERSLTDRVREAAYSVLDPSGVDRKADEIFDLVYNPFPAQLKIIIHGQTLAFESFNKIDSETFEVKTMSAPDAVAALEGRWISPDPLAVASRPEAAKKNAQDLAAIMAAEPRHADPVVTEDEIASAIVDKLRPAPRYRLRWTTKRSRAS